MSKFQEDERVQEALEKGIDMRQYTRQIERDLRDLERQSIDDCTHLARSLRRYRVADGHMAHM